MYLYIYNHIYIYIYMFIYRHSYIDIYVYKFTMESDKLQGNIANSLLEPDPFIKKKNKKKSIIYNLSVVHSYQLKDFKNCFSLFAVSKLVYIIFHIDRNLKGQTQVYLIYNYCSKVLLKCGLLIMKL